MAPRCKFCGREEKVFRPQHRNGLFYKRIRAGMVYTGPGDHCQYFAWSTGGDSGISSKTVVVALTGAAVLGTSHPGAPLDAGDFGRCKRMLERFPWLRIGMPRLPELFSSWPRALSESWEELEALYVEGTVVDPIAVSAGVLPALDARLLELLS